MLEVNVSSCLPFTVVSHVIWEDRWRTSHILSFMGHQQIISISSLLQKKTYHVHYSNDVAKSLHIKLFHKPII